MSTAAIDAGAGGDRGRIETRRDSRFIAYDGAGSTVRRALDSATLARFAPIWLAVVRNPINRWFAGALEP